MRRVYKTKTVTEKAYQRLRNAIISNQLLPGQAIRIESLAQELGVSRTPIREALLMLKKEGLIDGEMAPGRGGVFVSGLSLQDLEEIFELREAIEIYAIRKLPEGLTSQHINAMRRALEKYRHPASEKETEKAAEADLDFHRSLVVASGNSRFLEVWNRHAVQLRRFWEDGRRSSDRVQEDIEECLAVVGALESGDVASAESMLKDHLAKTKKAIAAWWLRSNRAKVEDRP